MNTRVPLKSNLIENKYMNKYIDSDDDDDNDDDDDDSDKDWENNTILTTTPLLNLLQFNADNCHFAVGCKK